YSAPSGPDADALGEAEARGAGRTLSPPKLPLFGMPSTVRMSSVRGDTPSDAGLDGGSLRSPFHPRSLLHSRRAMTASNRRSAGLGAQERYVATDRAL